MLFECCVEVVMDAAKSFLFWAVVAVFSLMFVQTLVHIMDPDGVDADKASSAAKPASFETRPSEALAQARHRIRQYADAEGWSRAFMKTGTLNSKGYVCGTLYGETFGWNFTVRFIYNPRTNGIEVLNWATINNDPWFDSKWQLDCPKPT